jgi:mannose-6-phosphate isomerase
MGTHTSGPARIGDENGDTLLSQIQANPEYWLGSEKAAAGNIPFLLKILSINQALSIQAHPHKSLAEQLHREQPDK